MCAASVGSHTPHAQRKHGALLRLHAPVMLATLPHVWSSPQVEGTPRRGWLAGPGETLLAPPTGFTAQHGRPPLRLGHLRPPSPVGQGPRHGVFWLRSLGT